MSWANTSDGNPVLDLKIKYFFMFFLIFQEINNKTKKHCDNYEIVEKSLNISDHT